MLKGIKEQNSGYLLEAWNLTLRFHDLAQYLQIYLLNGNQLTEHQKKKIPSERTILQHNQITAWVLFKIK